MYYPPRMDSSKLLEYTYILRTLNFSWPEHKIYGKNKGHKK